MDENSPVRNQLLVGLGVLLVVALLIGGIVGFVAVKAADVAGLGEEDSDRSRQADSGPPLGLGTNTPPSEPTSTTSTTPTETTPTTTTPTQTTKTREPKPQPAITLDASPVEAGAYERINLTGRYPRGDGAVLQVQRRLPGEAWTDFPTDASVSGGTYSTYIETGQAGKNELRMIDTESGRTSNSVTVTVG